MKNVLYISNIEVPYRTKFFNKLSKECNLTVLYEREKSSNRDEKWSSNLKSNYNKIFLNGIKIKNEYSFNPLILKYVFSKKYDDIILGCYNSPSQMFVILILKLLKKKYLLNIDGEYFIEGKSLKAKIKRFFIKGATNYLVAGEESAKSIKKIVKTEKVFTYYFSSLSQKQINENNKNKNVNRNEMILVVGQYFDYKGLDIALEVAKMNPNLQYKFIGSGKRSDLLKQRSFEMNIQNNVIIIPFLQEEELYNEYQSCKLLLLPSRNECWGLVINEAASFGTPIISTCGSGAAVEFIKEKYPQYIAETNNPKDLYNKIENILSCNDIEEYKNYLIEKSKDYNIEHAVSVYVNVINS